MPFKHVECPFPEGGTLFGSSVSKRKIDTDKQLTGMGSPFSVWEEFHLLIVIHSLARAAKTPALTCIHS